MKILSRGRSVTLGLALVAAGLAAPQLGGNPASAAKPDPTLVSQMRSTADGNVALRANPATGKVGFVRATGASADLLPGKAADDRASAVAKADAYIDSYGAAFGAAPGQLQRSEVYADRYGWSVSYRQAYQGIPVFGAEVKAHVDKSGDLTSVNGYAAPGLSLSTTPRFSEADARARALAMVEERPAGYEDGGPAGYRDGLAVRSIDLEVYRMGSTRGIQGEAKLAWVVEVWNKSTVRETIILDAETGKYLNRWSMMADDLDRTLVEANGSDDPSTFTEVWHEGDAFPADLDQDQQNEVLGTAEAYWMFRNTFGRDSYDGKGHPMTTVNNDGRIDCPNANWNGVTTNYCDGVTGDDTVVHEWSHAYTEYTSGLIYQWQSGAMNEAYSDIWGETADMLNHRMNDKGETQADPIERTPGTCSNYTRSPINFKITAPAEIAGDCDAAPASFGPVITQTPVTAQLVVGTDAADAAGPSTTDGCSALDNAADIAGNWVFVDRGTCTFAVKIAHAEDAGAEGIVIGDNRPEPPFSLSGRSDLYGVLVDQASGTRIKSVPGPVTIEVAAQPATTDDTYRWLSGENDPAFGGAIRDMWNPNCYGDPGRVSDQEYICDGSVDHGGVHTNSGIVNRTYAILVDGYGSSVPAIGLDKAANLFWHTQTNYLTPISGFPDLADGLEASCADLTGQPINKVTLPNPTRPDEADGAVTPEAADPITAADCAAVTAAISETELRKDPVQCNFQPMLEKGTVTCGDGFDTKTVWSEDFEDGLDGWTKDAEFYVDGDPPTTTTDPTGDYPGGHVSHPWETTTDLPPVTRLPGGAGQHPDSTVAFSPDPETGSCGLDAEDESSRDGLISPEVTVPEGFQPRLSFAHYVATEQGFDGGNVKMSINGGDFEQIPAEAWILNGPGATLSTNAEGNTDPMAGEAAWTGTDGGQPTGSWGMSVANLNRAGAEAGDVVQFRFDMGRDGCNGPDGWYVDDIAVTVCKEALAATSVDVVSVKPDPVVKGKPFTVKVQVTSDGGVPTGTVSLRDGKRALGEGTLDAHGTAKITVTRFLSLGIHRLVASYSGDDQFAPSRTRFKVRVVK